MHVTPTELRSVQRGDLLLRLALLDRMAYVLVETPALGSRGTTLEEPCTSPHWGVVLRGRLELARNRETQVLRAGTAFHVPSGAPSHTFRATERTVFAGFVPLDVGHAFGAPLSNGGEEPQARLEEPVHLDETVLVQLMPGVSTVPVRTGSVEAEAAVMGDWVVTRATFGSTSGFGTAWCDVPHWGMVLTGAVGIEWENDVEVLTAGDVYYCPPGPPGHRIEAADAATVFDFTPRDALRATERIADWRPRVDVLETARQR